MIELTSLAFVSFAKNSFNFSLISFIVCPFNFDSLILLHFTFYIKLVLFIKQKETGEKNYSPLFKSVRILLQLLKEFDSKLKNFFDSHFCRIDVVVL